MTIFFHELKRSRISLLIWTAVLAFMMGITVLIFPQMKPQMSQMENMMSDMGSFSAAFGMDKMSFGRFTDYFAIECGNILGIGGAIFSAIFGVNMLSNEEKEHTAEFLYVHPVSRFRIVTEKLAALVAQVVVLNTAVAAISLVTVASIGEDSDISVLLLLFLAYMLLELEIAMICFGISAFLQSGIGVGIGTSIGMYFLNIIANITEDAKFLKYITPFAYTEGADIIKNHTISATYLLIGMCMALVAVVIAFYRIQTKDLK